MFREAGMFGEAGAIRVITATPDDRLLAVGGVDGAIRLWDVASGSQVRILRGHTDRVSGLAFSADGKYLASGGYDRTIRLWYRPRGYAPRVLGGHWGRVLDLAFSPDGSRLASAGNDSRVRLWDVNAGTQVAAQHGLFFVGQSHGSGFIAHFLEGRPLRPPG